MRIKVEECIGNSYGYLKIIADAGTKLDAGCFRRQVFVECKCGNKKTVFLRNIVNGLTTSCGCYAKEIQRQSLTVHGKYNPELYHKWRNMHRRCYNVKDKRYKDYGGRGIKVCEEWHIAEKFYDWCLANGWQNGLQIDRFPNNDGNYEPGNCRFVSVPDNCRNKRNNRILSYDGEEMTLTDFAEKYNIKRQVLIDRLRLNWPLEKIVTTPLLSKIDQSVL